jgi:hypothetical protein
MAEAAVIEVRAIDFYFFFCVLQKTKTSEHNTKIGRVSFLCMCVLFFLFFLMFFVFIIVFFFFGFDFGIGFFFATLLLC